MRQSPCTSVPYSPLYFLSSVPRSLLSKPMSGTKPGLLNGTKLCPLSFNQDSTWEEWLIQQVTLNGSTAFWCI